MSRGGREYRKRSSKSGSTAVKNFMSKKPRNKDAKSGHFADEGEKMDRLVTQNIASKKRECWKTQIQSGAGNPRLKLNGGLGGEEAEDPPRLSRDDY